MRLFIIKISIFMYWPVLGQQVKVNGAGSPVTINGAGQPSNITINYMPAEWQSQSVIGDDGYYNGFPMLADAIGFNTVGVFKKSPNHAAGGPLTLVKTLNGGMLWTEVNIKVDGVEISSTNHSFIRHSTGRLIISYRVNGIIYFAYNGNEDENFTSSVTTVSPGVDNDVAQSPVKMIEMPSGNILFFYYQVGSNGNPTKGSIMESSDAGLTFSFKSDIYSHNSAVSGATTGDWRGNEITGCITHNTGIDSTTKLIALIRPEVPNDGGTYYMHYKSEDGGTTWSTDLVNRDPGSFIDDNGNNIVNNSPGLSRHVLYTFLASNSPVDLINHNDTIYIVNGERNITYGIALKYAYATPDGAYRNKFNDWIRPVFKKFYNIGGSTVDHGYPVFFKANNTLYVAQYDFSPNPTIPEKASRRELVEIYKLLD